MASAAPLDSSTGLATVSADPDIRLFYKVTPALPLDLARPTVILSSSLAAGTSLWDEFTAALAPAYNVIRYDARFHVQSPLSTTPGFDYANGHTIDDLADDVIAVLDAVGAKGRIKAFVGLSIGGGVGVSLAARYPLRFEKLVIVGTKANAGPEDAERFASRAAYLREAGAQAQAKQSVERWFDAGWIEQNPKRAAAVESEVAQTPVQGFVASAAALTKLDLWAHAESIKKQNRGQDVLFIVGDGDATPVIDESKALAETTGSGFEIVKQAGHIVNVQQPAVFHRLVREFLESSAA